MQRSLLLTREPIHETALAVDGPASNTAGAVVRFLGVVRASEEDRPIAALDYSAFESMAEHQFEKLFNTAAERWPSLERVRLVHRLGPVPAGQPSLWVEVAAPHRADAFAACQWLIDEMKRVVPIWKRPVEEPHS